MAIYISGVKGLPEQVQENKENIKNIQEQIEGIDFDAIRELEEQVEENTGDINSLEGTIGTQNIAITQLGNRADTVELKVANLENKTQEIIYDAVNDETVMQDVKAHTLTITADNYGITSNEVVGKGGKGAVVLATDSNPTTSLVNNTSGTNHSFNLNNDGSVDVDGNPIVPHLYEHNIVLGDSVPFSSSAEAVAFKILTTTATAFNDISEVANLLYTRGFNGLGSYFVASGRFSDDSFPYITNVDFVAQTTDESYCDSTIIGVYGTNADDLIIVVNNLSEDASTPVYSASSPSNYFNDIVVQLL